MANWTKIRNEYINGNISYAKLAEKHKVSLQTIKDKGTKEKWVAQKKEQQTKIKQKTDQKTAEILAQKEADRLLRISTAADRLLEKIEEATEQLDQFIVTNKVKQKEVEYISGKAGFGKPKKEIVKEVEDKRVISSGHIDKLGLKQLASALKDLKDIQFTKEEDKPEEAPNINITVMAATPEDLEGDE